MQHFTFYLSEGHLPKMLIRGYLGNQFIKDNFGGNYYVTNLLMAGIPLY